MIAGYRYKGDSPLGDAVERFLKQLDSRNRSDSAIKDIPCQHNYVRSVFIERIKERVPDKIFLIVEH